MTRDVRDALASHTTDYAVRGKLREMPPHAVYEVEFDGTRAVCKLARGPEADPALEANVLRYVADDTPVPVPPVLAWADDHFVAEWADDAPHGPALDRAKARAMGAGLATLHDAAAPDFDRTGTLRVDGDGLGVEGQDRWSDTLRSVLGERAAFLDDVGHGDVAREVRRFVGEARDLFDETADATLLHGNWVADHVGVDPSPEPAVACVIDFEHALVGPAGYDYVRTVLPQFVGPRGDEHDVPESAFREAYESVRPLPPGFDDRRDAYVAVVTVSFLQALYVQRAGIDDPGEVAANADAVRGHVERALDHLRDRRR
jgi:fructosamine-3-kinase